jgi:hypothetical protein
VTDDSDEAEECSTLTTARCKFETSNNNWLDHDCVVHDPFIKNDIEHRYNVIEELASGGKDNSDKAFKLIYQCKKNLCNNAEHAEKVIGLHPSEEVVQ